MARFSDLSNELVLEILQHVAPCDLDSACTITKSIYLLAAPILVEHRRLNQHLSSINYLGDQDHPLANLLLLILAKPRNAHYVRSLTMECLASGWGDTLTDDDLGSPASVQSQMYQYESKDLQLLRTAVETSDIISADEVDEWLQTIQEGSEDPILALLLLNLPNLNSLEILSIGMPIENLSRIIQRIKNGSASSYLSHLKRVSMNFDEDWETSDTMICFTSFMSLPSLTSYHIEDLSISDDESDLERHLRLHKSNIADLAFTHCRIGEKTLFEVLRSTKNLRSFSYTYLRPAVRFLARQGLDWYWLGVGLLHNTRHSLEKLTLLPHGCVESKGCSLRDFEVLREIDTELALFSNDNESSVQSFPEMLPASIRIIRLRSPRDHFMSESDASGILKRIQEAILSILEVKNVLLPQLTEIQVFPDQDEGCSVFRDTPKLCDAQGILFTLNNCPL